MADKLYFFPKLNDELIENADIVVGKYDYSFEFEGESYRLKESGKSVKKLEMEGDSIVWKIEDDGLRIQKSVFVQYPHLLYGKDGIACTGAEIGVCIYWTNNSLTQAGCILPSEEIGKTSKTWEFDHVFPPHMVKGDLELELAFYLRKAVDVVPEHEEALANEVGLHLGTIEDTILDFDNAFMDFPIETVNDSKLPLWWFDMFPWSDPRNDMFSRDNMCLYLNTAYKNCPAAGSEIANIDLLVEIMTQVYFCIFTRIEDMGAKEDTLGDKSLSPNSISRIMNRFYDDCKNYEPLQFESPEKLLRTINVNVRRILCEEDDEE